MGHNLAQPVRQGQAKNISHLGAIGLAIAAFTFWVLCDSAIKLAGKSALPNYEIVGFLGAFMAVLTYAYSAARGDAEAVRTERPKRLLLRGCLDAGNNLGVVVAVRHLSLTLFYILVFLTPLVTVILSRIFLKERFDWKKGAAIMVGFFGVVVAVDPLHSITKGDWTGYGACAVCVACFSAVIVWSRVISQTERPESITFFSGLSAAGAGVIGMLFYAAPLTLRLLAVLIVMSVFCAAGVVCFNLALKYAPASTVSQYHYTQLVTGAMIAYLVFHEKPTSSMLLGALLIIASGLSIAMRAPAA